MINEIESEELMKFFIASSKFMVHAIGRDVSENDAFKKSMEMLSRLSPAKKLSGLKQTANDTLDMIQDLNPEQEKIFEDILAKEGGKPLSYFKSKNKKVLSRLLGKSSLKSEADYYALKNHYESEWQNMGKEKADAIRKKLYDFEASKLTGKDRQFPVFE